MFAACWVGGAETEDRETEGSGGNKLLCFGSCLCVNLCVEARATLAVLPQDPVYLGFGEHGLSLGFQTCWFG